jgi:hypothetical protein
LQRSKAELKALLDNEDRRRVLVGHINGALDQGRDPEARDIEELVGLLTPIELLELWPVAIAVLAKPVTTSVQ